MTRLISVLKCRGNYIILSLKDIYFFHKCISSSNFAYSATVKPRPSADSIGMKISVLPTTQLEFTVIESTNLQGILQIA